MVVHSDRRPPFILGEKGLPRMPIEADPGPAAGRKVLSIIDVTLDEVRRRG